MYVCVYQRLKAREKIKSNRGYFLYFVENSTNFRLLTNYDKEKYKEKYPIGDLGRFGACNSAPTVRRCRFGEN